MLNSNETNDTRNEDAPVIILDFDNVVGDPHIQEIFSKFGSSNKRLAQRRNK